MKQRYASICCGVDVLARAGFRHCSVCHQVKTVGEFFAHANAPDGRRSQCKPCYTVRCKAYFAVNSERVLTATRARRLAQPEQTKMYSTAWAVRHPDLLRLAHRVHVQVQRTIAAGRLIRPDECEQCGKTGHIEAAHFDYTRPLDVRWLCRSCHRSWDRREPKLRGVAP